MKCGVEANRKKYGSHSNGNNCVDKEDIHDEFRCKHKQTIKQTKRCLRKEDSE